ncbi:ATP-binding protein [Arcobacter sp. F155]|uniref:ATP-binding protein n=1 Tax=Arcobacter sp. F155 TaxID=2044512 RepID=UPI0013E951F2|nr:ATP-binding protein [Arcobacter sp. F155]
MNKSIVTRFIFVYIFFLLTITTIFYFNYQKTIENHFQKTTKESFSEYKAVYDRNKQIADLIFQSEINTNKILTIFKDAYLSNKEQRDEIRKELYEVLKEKYYKLKAFNLRQLHFHLPNNDSFLRMHRPQKYGDNLSHISETVRYVNQNKKYIHGFEEGRIFNGFRFIYPLFFRNMHIGSVEISFNSLAMIKAIKETYNKNSHFLIKKDVVDKKLFEDEKSNYLQSQYKEFYYEKEIVSYHKPLLIKNNTKQLTKKIYEGEPFSIFLEKYNIIKTFIPIKNPINKEVVAVLFICKSDSFINKEFKDIVILFICTFFGISLIFYLFYLQKRANEKLKKINNELDRRVDLEIKRNRKKDISLLKQSKMAAITEMLAHIAHQWRQPLNVISTSSSGLILHKEMGKLDDKSFELYTKSISEQVQYLSKTIDKFKEFVKDQEDEKKTICLQKKVDEIIEIVQASFEDEGIEIIKKFKKENLFVSIHTGDLIQVVLNILNNAKDALIKNNPKKKRIIITIKRKKNGNVLLAIYDNAGGIPQEYAEKVFDPYFTTKHEAVGTGISLYLSYEIITNQEKGKIYFKNKDEGTKFYLELKESI